MGLDKEVAGAIFWKSLALKGNPGEGRFRKKEQRGN
jgi:hypothetical protein